jgi:hypothetical protein
MAIGLMKRKTAKRKTAKRAMRLFTARSSQAGFERLNAPGTI